MGAPKGSILVLSALALMFLPLASAGLSIEQGNLEVNKTLGSNSTVILTVSNDEAFGFQNISFVENPYISVPQFDLAALETRNITATVTADDDAQIDLRMKGFYLSNVGQQDKLHGINVSFTTGLSQCSFSIVKGDTVQWFNQVNDEIKAINADNGQDAFTIPQGGNKTQNFSSISTFNYHFSRLGFQFAPTSGACQITILDDTGFINNPDHDGHLSLNVNVDYPPTEIEAAVPVTSYTMNFFDVASDQVLTVKNIGNKTAKKVHLSGEWFSFAANDFDLAPGETKGVLYSIRPLVGGTADTNTTHVKPILITGNFPPKEQPIDIFIKFAQIGDSNSTGNVSSLIDYICSLRPEFCQPQVVFKAVNNGSQSAQFNITEEQYRAIWSVLFDLRDLVETGHNFDKDASTEIISNISQINSLQQNLTTKVIELEERDAARTATTRGLVNMIALLILLGVLCTMVYRAYQKKKEKEAQIY